MIGAGNFLVTRERHALPPQFHYCFALTQKLADFQRADDCVEASPSRHAPIERRHAARFRFVEPQILICDTCTSGRRSNTPEIA